MNTLGLNTLRRIASGCLLAILCVGATALAKAPKAEPIKITRSGATVTLTWVLQGEPKYQEVMRDTDNDPKGRQRVKSVHGDVRSFTDTVPEEKANYWYWIKMVGTDGKVTNFGPVKAAATKN